MKPKTSSAAKDSLERVAIPIAHYYGFRPLDEVLRYKRVIVPPLPGVPVKKDDSKVRNTLPLPEAPMPSLDPFAKDAEKILHSLSKRGHLPPEEPLFVFWRPQNTKAAFALGVIGTPLSVAEAFLIKTAQSILTESTKGQSEMVVDIGSQGDRESSLRFCRDVLVAVRKREDELPREIRILARDDPATAAKMIHDKHPSFAPHLPSPTDYLSDKSRTHLREVLEHLEASDIPYAMRSSAIGHPDWHSDTIFEIRVSGQDSLNGETTVAARGARYDEYAKRLSKSKTGAALLFFFGKRSTQIPFPREKHPFAYFIHIGFDARLFGVTLMESLRPFRVPMRHSFGTAGFKEQLQKAESSKSPYAIIMGHKEALERSVILRDMNTHAQEYLPLATVGKRLAILAEKRKR